MVLQKGHKICLVLVTFSYSERSMIKSEGSKLRTREISLLYEVVLVLLAGKEANFLWLSSYQPPTSAEPQGPGFFNTQNLLLG